MNRSTFVQAAIWFAWWPAKGESPVVWFVIAYAAYIAGLNVARYETGLGGRMMGLDSRARWRWRKGTKGDSVGYPRFLGQ
jgi:hypothetical protein